MNRLLKPLVFATEMSRSRILTAGVLLLLGGVVAWRLNEHAAPETPFEISSKPPASGPLCPWREPAADLARFFPAATRYATETRILSGVRDELTQQLGRSPTGDENALHVYRVYQDQTPLGNVLTGRVKAEHGALEVVVATTLDGAVQGVRVQRLREPSPVAVALQDTKWLASFTGHRARDEFKIGKDIGDISREARDSAMALTQGVRDLLILLNAADKAVPVSHHGS